MGSQTVRMKCAAQRPGDMPGEQGRRDPSDIRARQGNLSWAQRKRQDRLSFRTYMSSDECYCRKSKFAASP
eukprot:287397-Amphidinium_carterae.1